MREQQQGTMVDCVYCKYIHPELLEGDKCPICKGINPQFRPARMMDHSTSQMEVLYSIFNEFPRERREANPSDFKDALLSLLLKLDIYQLDFKELVIQSIKEIEFEI